MLWNSVRYCYLIKAHTIYVMPVYSMYKKSRIDSDKLLSDYKKILNEKKSGKTMKRRNVLKLMGFGIGWS